MGQTLTSLNSILKTKKNYIMSDEIVASIAVDKENSTCDEDIARNYECSIDLPTKNDDETHQHFENIYNSSSELTGMASPADSVDVESLINDTPEKNVSSSINTIDKSKSSKARKSSKKKKSHWVRKFNCARLKSGSSSSACSEPDIADQNEQTVSCVCTGYRRTESQVANSSEASSSLPIIVPKEQLGLLQNLQMCSASTDSDTETVESRTEPSSSSQNQAAAAAAAAEPVIDLSKFNPEDYPIEDCDERARLERAREIAEGVDPPPGFSPKHQIELVCHSGLNLDNLTALFQSALSLSALSQIDVPKSVHTQIDYIHCLVPDLFQITSCSFYWCKMDRYEAERLLENKVEGTFLLRDSAQEEHLFSVSFRKYGRSLHARIEQWNHRFSFDSHDPGVFSANTVCGLIEHYKDPTCCMFFEPMLTVPLHRNFPFSLQHLCRAVICDHLTYDSISYLKLPKTMKAYLKEYHYKQRVRVRKFESEP